MYPRPVPAGPRVRAWEGRCTSLTSADLVGSPVVQGPCYPPQEWGPELACRLGDGARTHSLPVPLLHS